MKLQKNLSWLFFCSQYLKKRVLPLKKQKRLFRLMIILVITVIGLFLFGVKGMLQGNEKESKEMLQYLEEKYNQEFKVGEVEEYKLGFAAGKITQAKAYEKSNEEHLFIISKDSNIAEFEDTYEEVLLEAYCQEKFSHTIQEFDSEARYYIKTSYDGKLIKGPQDFSTIEVEKLNPSLFIAVLVEPPFSKDAYITKLQNLLFGMDNGNTGKYRIEVDFVALNNSGNVDAYFTNTQKELTQKELEEINYSGIKNNYESAVIGRFVYDSSSRESSNSPEEIKNMFITKYENQ